MAFLVMLIFTCACAGCRCVSGQCWDKSEDDRTGNANYTKSGKGRQTPIHSEFPAKLHKGWKGASTSHTQSVSFACFLVSVLSRLLVYVLGRPFGLFCDANNVDLGH